MKTEKYIQKFLDYFHYEKNYSSYTITNYQNDISEFSKFLKQEKLHLKEVDYQTIRRYLKLLYDKNLSKKTIARKISSLRTFFKYLLREKCITKNPMTLITNPKLDKTLPKFLYQSDLEEILNIPDKETPLGIRNSLILELLYSTGIRVGELINIKVSDINFHTKQIKILGKGNKERYVLYGNYLEEILELYLKKSRNKLLTKNIPYLFLNKNGGRLTDRGVRLIINNIMSKSNVDLKVSPHVLRHTFATHMLDNGADIKVVQELLGHESLSTTQIYTHLSNERLREVYLSTHPRAKKD